MIKRYIALTAIVFGFAVIITESAFAGNRRAGEPCNTNDDCAGALFCSNNKKCKEDGGR
jgi:hypothetical protein